MTEQPCRLPGQKTVFHELPDMALLYGASQDMDSRSGVSATVLRCRLVVVSAGRPKGVESTRSRQSHWVELYVHDPQHAALIMLLLFGMRLDSLNPIAGHDEQAMTIICSHFFVVHKVCAREKTAGSPDEASTKPFSANPCRCCRTTVGSLI